MPNNTIKACNSILKFLSKSRISCNKPIVHTLMHLYCGNTGCRVFNWGWEELQNWKNVRGIILR